ncbi:50S ribosomal protein L19, partial [Candidatus Bipolaricaulota bacterium]|nr:50S ribosomal protein L19 [Candidatus Bipolaricaulota bacterium]
KIYPLHSPKVEKIELVKSNHIRQARPYFLRRLRRIR